MPKITTDDHYYQSVAAMSRSKLVALKVLFHALIRRVDFKGIDETNRTHSRFETRHTLRSISHKSNLLSWDQYVAASNSAALLATWQYFSFRHIRFSKLSSYQKLSQIIISHFSNGLSFEQGKRSFQISGKLSSFAKITNKKIARHFEI